MAITGIISTNGELLPGIFTRFPNITAVRLILACRQGLSKDQMAAQLAAFGHALPHALESLAVIVRDTVTSSIFNCDESASHQPLHSLEAFICDTLHLLPCASTLKTVHMSSITGRGAQRLLQLLHSATDVALYVVDAAQPAGLPRGISSTSTTTSSTPRMNSSTP